MAYCHEGLAVPATSEADFIAATTFVNAGTGTDAELGTATGTITMYYVSRDFPTYANWYIVLIACTQVRELTDANLENFGKMCGGKTISSGIRRFLHYWAYSQDRLVDNAAIRTRFIANTFFEYHTISCSTPDLCIKAINEAVTLNVFSEEEVNTVNAAARNVSDLSAARRIADVTIVKARAVLESANMLPDTWYMGTHALSRFSGRTYAGIVAIIRKIFELKNNTANIADADIPTLVTRLRDMIN
jgi:hypothetical protein